MTDKLIQLEQEYLKIFPKADLIAYGFTYYKPEIKSIDELENIYEKCIKEGKRWEELYKIVGTEGIRE